MLGNNTTQGLDTAPAWDNVTAESGLSRQPSIQRNLIRLETAGCNWHHPATQKPRKGVSGWGKKKNTESPQMQFEEFIPVVLEMYEIQF